MNTDTLLGALLGALVACLVTHILSERRERAKLLREKGEAIMLHLLNDREWVHKLVMFPATANQHDNATAWMKAWILQQLHFPELKEAFITFSTVRDAVMQAIPLALQPPQGNKPGCVSSPALTAAMLAFDTKAVELGNLVMHRINKRAGLKS